MKLGEILCSGSDERYRRKSWPITFIETDLDSGRIFFRVPISELNTCYTFLWIPSTDDLLANDWEFWSMPDVE